ncbi:SHOCT domain-containing protein [Curtobacterium sp. MCJR17_020]|uniref:SHOCT domain-containing protein n=1 Tax=Curtobacterium sp. MCJR17_020 TaxID=2175619 RepID=UPI000DA6EACC|nr:SHOCT domain-containing protein [Curtobacterium sp. MCJR17_020]WIE72481.1 SHOCT domain-containing protein [Curtobacterium sp. MCJR17_020]
MIASEELHNPLIPPLYDIVWSVVMGLIVVAVVVTVWIAVVRSRRSDGAPRTLREQRLAELDDLHARGAITDDEHRAARADALRG